MITSVGRQQLGKALASVLSRLALQRELVGCCVNSRLIQQALFMRSFPETKIRVPIQPYLRRKLSILEYIGLCNLILAEVSNITSCYLLKKGEHPCC